MADYRRSAQSRGYRPGRVDQSNLQRMREDSDRTAQNMRQRAEMEINERRRTLAQEKEDQAATRRMEEKNFQIQDQNMKNELRGLQLKQQADQQQIAADAKANEAIFNTIANLSTTAAKVVSTVQTEREAAKYRDQFGDTSRDDTINAQAERVAQNILGIQKVAAVNKLEQTGTLDPLAGETMKGSDDALGTNATFGQVSGFTRRGGYVQLLNSLKMQFADAKQAQGLGGLTAQDHRDVVNAAREALKTTYSQEYSPKYVQAEFDYLNQIDATFLKTASDAEVKERKEQRHAIALANIESAPSELFNATFNNSWTHIVDANGGDRSKSWQDVKTVLNAQDPVTGEFYREQGEIDNLIIVTEAHPQGIEFGKLYSNKQGLPVGIRREILSDRIQKTIDHERQQEQLDTVRHKEYEDELTRAVQLNPTMANIAEAQRLYVEKTGGKASQALANISKYISIEAVHRNHEFERIASLPDYELTPELVDAAKAVNPTEGAVIEQRYKEGPGQFRTKPVQDIIKKAESVITGTTEFGTAKLGKAGSLPARIHFRAKIMKQAKLLYGNGQNGYTVEEAVAKATSDEADAYNASYRTEGTEYYRKVNANGTVSYPWIESRQGNVAAAEKAYRDYESLREQVKSIGLKSVLNIPNSFMTAERMEYVAQNYGEPGFTPTPLERAVQGFSNGMPLHEVYNRAFAAGGRKETFEPPQVVSAINFTPEQQRILNDADASFESKVHTVNVAAGNTQYYAQAPSMRFGSPMRQAVGSRQENAFIQTIRTVEGTAGPDGYNTVYGGAVVPQLTKMTLGELYDAIKLGGTDAIPARLGGGKIPFKKDQYNSSASGALQLMPETLKDLVETGGYNWNDTFSPETQNRMIIDLARRGGVDIENMSPQQMEKAGNIWAGATPNYGQTDRTAADSYDIYQNLLQQ